MLAFGERDRGELGDASAFRDGTNVNAALAQLNAAYFGPKTAWIMIQVTLSTLSGQLTKYDQILVQEYVHFEQVNVLTDDLCCAKNIVLCSAGEKQMSLNLLISCGGVIATLSIARSATGRMLVKSVWGWIKQLFQKPHETGSSHSEGVVEIRVYGKTRPSRIAPSMRVVSF
jgi:hypothetical protein